MALQLESCYNDDTNLENPTFLFTEPSPLFKLQFREPYFETSQEKLKVGRRNERDNLE